MQTLEWFLQRVEGYILRGTTEVYIETDEVAHKLFAVQSPAYSFTAKVIIHRAPQEECESCSA